MKNFKTKKALNWAKKSADGRRNPISGTTPFSRLYDFAKLAESEGCTPKQMAYAFLLQAESYFCEAFEEYSWDSTPDDAEAIVIGALNHGYLDGDFPYPSKENIEKSRSI